MTTNRAPATWGPFDCKPFTFAVDHDGVPYLAPCDCGAEHPRLAPPVRPRRYRPRQHDDRPAGPDGAEP